MPDDDKLYDQRIATAEENDRINPVPRWIVARRDMFSAHGIFPSEAAAWRFARARGWVMAEIDTIPLGYAD